MTTDDWEKAAQYWEKAAQYAGKEWIRESKRLVAFRDRIIKEMPENMSLILRLFNEVLRDEPKELTKPATTHSYISQAQANSLYIEPAKPDKPQPHQFVPVCKVCGLSAHA